MGSGHPPAATGVGCGLDGVRSLLLALASSDLPCTLVFRHLPAQLGHLRGFPSQNWGGGGSDGLARDMPGSGPRSFQEAPVSPQPGKGSLWKCTASQYSSQESSSGPHGDRGLSEGLTTVVKAAELTSAHSPPLDLLKEGAHRGSGLERSAEAGVEPALLLAVCLSECTASGELVSLL